MKKFLDFLVWSFLKHWFREGREINNCSCSGVVIFVASRNTVARVSEVGFVYQCRVEWSRQDFRFLQSCVEIISRARHVHSQQCTKTEVGFYFSHPCEISED